MGLIELKHNLILGSQSPRRKELLSMLDLQYEIRIPDIDEVYPIETPKKDIAEFIANLKLSHLLNTALPEDLIVCSDTVVLINDEILEKPKNKQGAKHMLRQLSGKTHEVLTSVALGTKDRRISFTDTTFVSFNILTDSEIEYYIDNYSPYDKAGSYGVQDWIGMVAIKSITGSFYTVMGLPIHLVYQELKNWH
ncbi:MAG: septum formation protein Maf [Bacteroidetes bacterium]|nr:septum formation protein Maf [Bacteroidota bacterium]